MAGKKSDLKLQLQQPVPAGVQIIPEEGTQQPHNQTEGLHPASHWGELKHIDEPVYSPNYYEQSRAPTVPEGGGEHRKYNYQEEFERSGFSGTCDVAIFTPRRHPMMRNGRLLTPTVIWKQGGPKEAFLSKHNLDETSSPYNWYRAFLPNKKKRNEPLYFCTDDWTTWTNIKANLANAGQKNKLYPTFVTFTCR